MHSKIFQISRSPISKEDYAKPDDYLDNSGDFADYIGDEFKGERRNEAIVFLSNLIKDVFTYKSGGEFAYKGVDALHAFKQKWADELHRLANAATPDNLFKDQTLYKIRATTKETHLRTSYRVDIKDWCDGVAYPFGELFEWAASQLKNGDKIYVGAIIDYHY